MRKLIIFAAAMIVGSCAKTPESIPAAYVAPSVYANMQCNDLVTEKRKLTANLAAASAKQNKARTSDIVGVMLVGLPISSMTGGDAESEVSSLKGRHVALNKELASKGCKYTL